MSSKNHTIDASGKKLGRIATQAATILMGKHTASFTKHLPGDASVTIINAGKLDLPEQKKLTERHSRYSGYPGGLKQPNLAEVISKKGVREVIRHAVKGMLPINKLRDVRMKRLTISE